MDPRPTKLRFQANSRYPKIRALGQAWAPQDDLYYWILARPWYQYVALVLASFVLVNAFFGFLYWLVPGSVANAPDEGFEHMFYFSVQTYATIGYGAMAPANRYAEVLVTLEAVLGMLTVAVMTGLTFAKFARPSARVLFTEKLVVSHRSGVPHLMVRMANWRHNQVLEASLRIMVLVVRKTPEGDVMRWPIELPLVRSSTANFMMTWTAMHEIDEESPFFGPEALERLRQQGAEIFLTFTGLDETTGQNVHARYAYRLEDIVWGARFADVVQILGDGTRVVDYERFHQVVLEAPSAP